MKQIGKIGRINQKANRRLKQLFMDKEVVWCEMCGTTSMLTFAHRHKRIYYRSHPELLSDYNQVLLLCQQCHNEIEYDREKSDEVFERLRGLE